MIEKIKTHLLALAEKIGFGTITVTYTLSRGKIVKATIEKTEKVELLD